MNAWNNNGKALLCLTWILGKDPLYSYTLNGNDIEVYVAALWLQLCSSILTSCFATPISIGASRSFSSTTRMPREFVICIIDKMAAYSRLNFGHYSIMTWEHHYGDLQPTIMTCASNVCTSPIVTHIKLSITHRTPSRGRFVLNRRPALEIYPKTKDLGPKTMKIGQKPLGVAGFWRFSMKMGIISIKPSRKWPKNDVFHVIPRVHRQNRRFWGLKLTFLGVKIDHFWV